MVHARRLIAILTGCATSCIASATVAHAVMLHDPAPVGSLFVTSPESSGTPLWQILAFVALGLLLAAAIVGMGYSLSHSWRSGPSQRSRTLSRF
jgi:hypothetical protein